MSEVYVHISSNDSEDVSTKEVAKQFIKEHSYISFHENKTNIGLDRNHDLMYSYCLTKYILLLADDDILLPGSLENIVCFLGGNDFLFAICNQRYLINGELEENKLFNYRENIICLNQLEALKAFSVNKPDAILPLLPYYGGIILDREKIDSIISYDERISFEGSFHQYIGVLWLALLKVKNNVFILNHVSVGQGADNDKTWFEYKEDVYSNLIKLYNVLPLNKQIRKDMFLILKYTGRRLGRIIMPIIRIKSRRWTL